MYHCHLRVSRPDPSTLMAFQPEKGVRMEQHVRAECLAWRDLGNHEASAHEEARSEMFSCYYSRSRETGTKAERVDEQTNQNE